MNTSAAGLGLAWLCFMHNFKYESGTFVNIKSLEFTSGASVRFERWLHLNAYVFVGTSKVLVSKLSSFSSVCVCAPICCFGLFWPRNADDDGTANIYHFEFVSDAFFAAIFAIICYYYHFVANAVAAHCRMY